MQDYLNALRHRCPPHRGLDMSLVRVPLVVLVLERIRAVTFLFRGSNRLTP
ncbi:amino acid--tRNA ligase-related protein [Streptomyces sp. NPDC056112]|uniref:amino acid--tRNA ligase-related protein n=1 Tax=unclassified Streptomyces TaxID=2593676 RepID=UPI001CD72832|nr:amino acid--tRNA ligase-related protein [Streptomyces sp. CoT10]